jgi:FecR protein
MARPLTPLGSLGAEVARALEDDGGQRAAAIEGARRQLPTLSASRPSAAPGRRLGFAVAFAAAAGLLLVWFVRRPGPLEFNVNGNAGVAQTWLAAPSSQPLAVAFSDGTQLSVGPSSRARVVDTDQHGADIALESGSLHAQVVHTPKSAWRIIAGPFTIRVTGTRFDAAWDPASQDFSLAVLEGSVMVSGSIVGNERPVRAGERLAASVVQGRLELQNAETAAAAAAGARQGPETHAAAGDQTASETPATPGSEAVTPKPEGSAKDAAGSWRELAKSGDLRRAFAAAEAHGFPSVCDSATSSELLLLGDAARLSGRSDRATEALLALRRRYPHDPRRSAAAFALGKVAFDQRHAYRQAAEWFATCVREQPNGALARESSGRKIEALRNAGDGAAAEQAARDYLGHYPDGPHADVARSLLK